MFSNIKIAAICAIFFTASAFADSEDWGYYRHNHDEYKTGYDQNYGAGYGRPVQYYPAQRAYYTPSVKYSAVQPVPINDHREMNGRPEREGRW